MRRIESKSFQNNTMFKLLPHNISRHRILFVLTLIALIYFSFSFIHKKEKISLINIDEKITSSLQACSTHEYRNTCLKDLSKDLLGMTTLSEILPVLERHEKEEPYFSFCHSLTHYLGQEAYKKLGNVPSVYAQATSACLGGIYHGAIEGYFIEKKITVDGTEEQDAIIGEHVRSICGKQEHYKKPQEFTECNHGLGHALMFVTDNDLIRALKLCDYAPSQGEQELCYTGALMQNSDSINDKTHPSKYGKAGDLIYPCPILEEKYQHMCYTYGVLSRLQYEEEKAVSICNSIPSDYRTECFATYGRDRTMATSSPEELVRQCSIIQNESYKKECIGGAGYNIIIRFGLSSPLPFTFCDLTQHNKEYCYEHVFRAVKTQTKDTAELETFCQKLSNETLNRECRRKIIQ